MISVETTESVSERDRIPFWNSIISDTFTSLSVSPIERQNFSARIKKGRLRDVGIAEVFSPGSCVEHTNAQINLETEPFFLVHLQLAGRSINRQCGREAILSAGDFTICDTTRPYSVSFDENNTMLVMRLPEARLSGVLAAPEELTCIPVRCQDAVGGFTSSVLTQIWRQLECASCDEQQVQSLERMVIDSLAVGFKDIANANVCNSSLQRSKRMRIVSYIEANLPQPDLTPNSVAKAFDISTRYLHQIFSSHGESVSQYVLRRRLELAAERLQHRSRTGQTISDVAFGLGFNSLTHFGRVFRERFGSPPKEFVLKHTHL